MISNFDLFYYQKECSYWQVYYYLSLMNNLQSAIKSTNLQFASGCTHLFYLKKQCFLAKKRTIKQTINYLEIPIISNFTMPEGTFMSTFSPIFFPNKPFPIGESMDILPDFKSASFSATKVYVIT